MAPVWPGSASTTRRPIAWRTRAMAARHAQRRAAARRLGRRLRRRGGVADGAEPLEPGRAREVVVAGQRRPRRRGERRLEADGVAGLERDRLGHGAHAHASGPLVRLVLLQRRHADASGAGPWWGAARRARRSRRRRPGPTCRCSTGARTASVRSLAAATPSAVASRAPVIRAAIRRRATVEVHGQRRHHRQQRRERPRLGGQQEIEGDASAEHHRQPQEPALLLGFEVAGEPGERQPPAGSLGVRHSQRRARLGHRLPRRR